MSEVLSQLGWVRGLPGDRRAKHPLTAPPNHAPLSERLLQFMREGL